jgi:DNA-binding LacI/PurR family transcriptional regulator
MAKATIQQIADNLDVSIATVSRALNGRKTVKRELKRQIFHEARRLNYRPKINAPVRTLAVLTPKPQHYTSMVEMSVVREFSFNDWVVEVFPPERFEYVVDHFVDGVVAVSFQGRQYEELVQEFAGTSMVMFNWLPDHEAHCVLSDHEQSGYLAGRRLCQAGHRKIGGIFQSRGDTIEPAWGSIQRRSGFERALREAGIEPVQQQMIICPTEGVESAVDTLLEMGVTAMFSSTESLTQRTMAILQGKHCLHIPKEISVIGLELPMGLSRYYPTLTRIEQPFDEIARRCRLRLEELILQPDMPPEKIFLSENRLIEGGTIAPPAGSGRRG